MKILEFADPDFARHYVEDGPARFVPGYSVMHRMAAQLIAEHASADASVLVLGAGGGLEICAMAGLQPGWTFHGVDPSTEMLAVARTVCATYSDRIAWTEGFIPDAPDGPFDGATCLLTLHFLADDGSKLQALQAIRQRLKPGSAFIMVDLCLDKTVPGYDALRDRYACFALNAGAGVEDVAHTRDRLKTVLHTVPPQRNETLLSEAGFADISLFFAGLSWRGWAAYA